MPGRDRSTADINRLLRRYKERQQGKKRRRVLWLPFRFVAGGLVLIFCVYFIIQSFMSLNTPLRTATALYSSVDESFTAVGYFVRAESVVRASYDGILEYTLTDGEKVARYAPYAAVYADRAAVETNQRIRDLDRRIDTLTASLTYGTDSSGTDKLASGISEQILNLSEIADSASYTRLSSSSESLKKLVVNRDFAFTNLEQANTLIESLKTQREELKKGLGKRETQLYAPRAGFFLSQADGYEELLTVSAIKKLMPEDLDGLDTAAAEAKANLNNSADGQAVGKVVTDFEWYFVTVLHAEDVARLSVGQRVYFQFDATGEERVQASVSSIGSRTAQETVVAFKSSQSMDRLISLRRQSASVILSTYEGLKVPREALRVDEEGKKGVYVVTGLYAQFKPIESVYETPEYFIVKTDAKNKNALLLYDEMITSAKEMSDKKVLK